MKASLGHLAQFVGDIAVDTHKRAHQSVLQNMWNPMVISIVIINANFVSHLTGNFNEIHLPDIRFHSHFETEKKKA